jgi:hypothetical protein
VYYDRSDEAKATIRQLEQDFRSLRLGHEAQCDARKRAALERAPSQASEPRMGSRHWWWHLAAFRFRAVGS